MVIILKTFYIFNLNKSTHILAKKNPYHIYLLLLTIYNQNKINIISAYNLFDEICNPINKEFYNIYLFDKLKDNEYYTKYRNIHMYNDYMNDEISKLTIMNTHIKIKSNKEDNIFITTIYDLDNLFICDFKNDYYNYSINKSKIKVK